MAASESLYFASESDWLYASVTQLFKGLGKREELLMWGVWVCPLKKYHGTIGENHGK